jgi:GT2 family glycosyltransferase
MNSPAERPQVLGKFLFVGEQKLHLRGVTYGTFATVEGREMLVPEVVDRDFRQMVKHGFNAVRTYTMPPKWCLDLAQSHGLRLMVGLPWEQHVAFLRSRSSRLSIERRVRNAVAEAAGHPAILAYAVGNEIPSSVVRWHGARAVEGFIERLCSAVKVEDPGALVTYVNYPSTEYLSLPAVDFFSFNVYLEQDEALRAYVRRLHNHAGDRPLVMAELGLDSLRHGAATQAATLERQVRLINAAGCAGAFVFSWTDEWHRGGQEILDWDFGLTTRDRRPKPALARVSRAFNETAAGPELQHDRPRVSVIVCTFNGARHLRQCLTHLGQLNYPDYEIIVVNDGSQDSSGAIASEFSNVRLITTPNLGLSQARNTGWAGATGEIVAYIDDDAYPDADWLNYIVHALHTSNHVGVGGPNIPPPGDGFIADCVSHSPGGPAHILLTDEVAEHIPGCNMAFWKDRLEEVGGFDPQFRVAGDDVDICWRLQERGWTIGFCPAAVVWHHRRNSIRTFLKQQLGYGKAEALLERKWPNKYNAAGHVQWSGRIYSRGLPGILSRSRIYYGFGGFAPFQLIYQAPGALGSILAIPEWWFLIFGTGVIAAFGVLWAPLFWAAPLFALALGAMAVQAVTSAARSCRSSHSGTHSCPKFVTVTSLLHVVQPLARLFGRIRHGLTAWRHSGARGGLFPWPRKNSLWSENWNDPAERLLALQAKLREKRAVFQHACPYESWDLEVKGGLLGACRARMLVEEHGQCRQFIKLKTWPTVALPAAVAVLILALLALLSMLDRAYFVASLFAFLSLGLLWRTIRECAWSQFAFRGILGQLEDSPAVPVPAERERPMVDAIARRQPEIEFVEPPLQQVRSSLS